MRFHLIMLILMFCLSSTVYCSQPQDESWKEQWKLEWEYRQIILKEKDFSKAEKMIQEIIQKADQAPFAYGLLVKLYRLQNDDEKANTVMNKALKKAGTVEEKRLLYIHWCKAYGSDFVLKLPSSMEDYFRVADSALKTLPKDTILIDNLVNESFSLIGFINGKAPQPQKIKNLEKWLLKRKQQHPKLSIIHYTLGKLYQSFLSDYDAAISAFRKASELEPESKGLFLSLGEALLRGGKPKEAEDILNKALNKKAVQGIDDGVILIEIAEAQLLQRNYDGALRTCKKSKDSVKEKYGPDFKYDEAENLEKILLLHKQKKTDEMVKVLKDYVGQKFPLEKDSRKWEAELLKVLIQKE